MPKNKPKNKSWKKNHDDESDDRESGSGIVKTDTWLNVKGKAVFLNIPKKDIKLVKNGKYGERVSFITSLDSIKRLADGEIEGVNLGTFAE